jgi:uncharacterized membrane protein YagU involved in acid resistance
MNTLETGIWSGVFATSPMTMVLFGMQRRLPPEERSPLPPATLTKEISGVSHPEATLLSHLGYGMSCGVAYSLLSPHVKAPPAVKGAAFGLAVWAGSYLGWTPAFRLRANAYNMPWKRNAMMIAAHVVWGAALGVSEEQLRHMGERALRGARKAPAAE